MNPMDFLLDNFGRHLVVGDASSSALLSSALSKSHEIFSKDGKPSTSRLTSGSWAIVRPGSTSLRFALRTPPIGISLEKTSRNDAFFAELASWDGSSPRVFMTFEKKPMPLANVYLSVDRRCVRICSPSGVETFDLDAPVSDRSRAFHRAWRKFVESSK